MSIFEAKAYIGNCVNSFDEDGDCCLNSLPWRDVSDFACSEEDREDITMQSFEENVDIPAEVISAIEGHAVSYSVMSGIYVLYDEDNDIHYFFG